MVFNSRKFYFLSDCFNQEIDHLNVYKHIIKKYFVDKQHISDYLPNIHILIKNDYGVSIPNKVLSNILFDLSREYPESIHYESKKDTPHLNISNLPKNLIESYGNFTDQYNDDVRLILESFNSYLGNNGLNAITLNDFDELFSKIEDNFLIKNINFQKFNNKLMHLFLEWIGNLFKKEKENSELVNLLNKLLVPVLVYTYFCDENNPEELAKTVVLDTNIIIYYLGANGKIRKIYVEEFFNFAKENGIVFEITIHTLDQVKSLFKNPDRFVNPELAAFCKSSPAVQSQIISDCANYLKRLFASKGITVTFPEINYSLEDKHKDEFNKLSQGLQSAKVAKGKYISEQSLFHDINIILYTKAIGNYSNYTQLFKLFLTNDFYLLSWVQRINKSNYDSHITPLITLDRYTLLLWIAGKNTSNKRFIGKTWAYVADSFSYFTNLTINEVLRKYNEAESNTPLLVDSYLSPYLLLSKIVDETCPQYLPEKYLPDENLSEILTKFSNEVKITINENNEKFSQTIEKVNIVTKERDEVKAKLVELQNELSKKTLENLDLKESKKFEDKIRNDILWIVVNKIRELLRVIMFWK